MKRTLFLCFFLFYSLAFSQIEENPFSNSDDQPYTYSQKTDNQFSDAGFDSYENPENTNYYRGTGPPGDDDTVPIDDHLAVLMMIAVAIIGYYAKAILRSEVSKP